MKSLNISEFDGISLDYKKRMMREDDRTNE